MRVLYDHQIAELQTHGGISRYFSQLIAQLGRCGLAETLLPAIRCDNEHFRALLPASSFRFDDGLTRVRRVLGRLHLPERELFRLWRRQRARLNRRATLRALAAGGFDLFHPTYYDPYFLPHLGGRPFVLTVYDMTHETAPQWFSPGDPTAARKALLARRATRVITISAWTARELTRRLSIDPARVEVVRLGGGEAPAAQPLAVPSEYVLYVGERGHRKNFARLLSALGALVPRFPGLRLICAGDRDFKAEEQRLFAEHGLAGRVLHVNASDAQLTFLYAHAALLAYPSLDEGFGLPVVEAFAAGCPVACSRAASLPEVAGDAAIWFDPLQEDSIAAAVSALLTDPTLRAAAIQRGRERARLFTWRRTAERTAAVYAACLAAA